MVGQALYRSAQLRCSELRDTTQWEHEARCGSTVAPLDVRHLLPSALEDVLRASSDRAATATYYRTVEAPQRQQRLRVLERACLQCHLTVLY